VAHEIEIEPAPGKGKTFSKKQQADKGNAFVVIFYKYFNSLRLALRRYFKPFYRAKWDEFPLKWDFFPVK
jgi:hypothetical protein